MSITVNVVGVTNITTSILNSNQVQVGVGTFVAQAVTGLLVTAGANVTVTTTSGTFTIIGRDPPVLSVNGKTGVVSLVASDVLAAAQSHTHAAVNITDFATEAAKYGPVSSVAGKTGTVTLTAADVGAASASHTHVAANVTDFATEAAKYGPVSSVNGRTGTVVISAVDVTAASATHAHSYVQSLNGQTGTLNIQAGANVTVTTSAGSITITGPAAGTGSGNVLSVNGRTGVVVLNSTDVSAASASHTHVAANITDFVTEAAKYGPVSSVAGKTGTVTLTAADVGAASATHTHVAANITDFVTEAAKYGPVSSVNGLTGTVTISTAGGGGTAVSVGSKSLTTTVNNYDAGTTDIVRVEATTDLTITGLAGGSSGVVRLLVNVGTNELTLASASGSSDSTNRFLITGGDRILRDGESASTFYDAVSQRWRLITDEPSAPPYLWATVAATANLHNYAPGTATVLRVDPTSARLVTGFAGGGSNKALRVVNVATNPITLVHGSTSSDTQNRLLIDTGTNRVLDENDQAELLYDPISLRWRVTPCCGGYSS